MGTLGGLLLWSPTQGPLNVPFEAGVYQGTGDETRVNIEYDLTEQDIAVLDALDESIIQQVQARSLEVFNKILCIDAVRERYTPLVRRKEGYNSRLQTKIDLEKVRVWDMDRALTEVPQGKFKGCLATPLVKLKHVWFMNQNFGVVVETQDIQVQPPSITCPF